MIAKNVDEAHKKPIIAPLDLVSQKDVVVPRLRNSNYVEGLQHGASRTTVGVLAVRWSVPWAFTWVLRPYTRFYDSFRRSLMGPHRAVRFMC